MNSDSEQPRGTRRSRSPSTDICNPVLATSPTTDHVIKNPLVDARTPGGHASIIIQGPYAGDQNIVYNTSVTGKL